MKDKNESPIMKILKLEVHLFACLFKRSVTLCFDFESAVETR